MNFGLIVSRLGEGFLTTLEIFFLTLLFSLPLGLLISFCSMSKFKPISWLSKTAVWVVRGTPLLLQLIVVYFLPWTLFKIPMRNLNFPFMEWKMLAVIIAFSLNYAIYFSEIYRSGIQSISRGQYEAGAVLGLTKSQTFRKIVFPQVVKRIMPPMSNEIITLVKDTALVSIIMVVEITREAYNIVAAFGSITPLFYSGAFYLIFNGLLTVLFSFIERKLSYYR
ncbi:MAG: amino acid ABC transporter permease [Bacillota bacterium]|jgi:polar amino acid transport system permease protein|nr:amino acid ABC transporter permease [Bacillota bacterium]HHU42801.1 amino acid ABC transporter permease [Clostridiales bacterium]